MKIKGEKKIKAADLILNENSYFYNKIEQIDDNFISKLFNKVSSDKKAKEIVSNDINVQYAVDGYNINYSLLVFNFEDSPTFVEEHVVVTPELKYGYLLIIQYEDFIIVNKRNVSGLKELYDRIKEIDYYTLSRLFVLNSSFFEKMNISNMDISDTALRRKILEALNLRNSLPIAVGSRYVLNSFRLNNNGERFSFSLNTSRINKLAEKIKFDDILKWSIDTAEKIKNFKRKTTYLDIFPLPTEYSVLIGNLTPSCILFDINSLLSEFENDRVIGICYVRGEKKRKIKSKVFCDRLKAFERFCELEYLQGEGKRKFRIKNDIDKSFHIVLNDKTISCRSRMLNQLFIDIDGDGECSLIDYINKKQKFIINFDKPDYIYFCRNLLQDERLLNTIDSLLSVFEPFPELSSMKSEKGEMGQKKSSFNKDSLFGFIERKLLNDSHVLVCDDLLRDEWADFIAIKDTELILCHAKHDTTTMSASSFHVLVSQAQKNIGRFLATEIEWYSKTKKWEGSYALDRIQTKIKRIRKGQDANGVVKEFLVAQSNVNFDKKVWLVVDYISKTDLQNEFNKLKNKGSNPSKPQISAFLWLISSLISICSEFGVKIKIACKE